MARAEPAEMHRKSRNIIDQLVPAGWSARDIHERLVRVYGAGDVPPHDALVNYIAAILRSSPPLSSDVTPLPSITLNGYNMSTDKGYQHQLLPSIVKFGRF